jgi:hypothetical protein
MPAVHPFEAALSVVGVIVGGIIILTLFVRLAGRFGRPLKVKVKPFLFDGVFDEHTRVTVHLKNNERLEHVRIIGLIDQQNAGLPHDLRTLLAIEHADGHRALIHAGAIRMIETAAPP